MAEASGGEFWREFKPVAQVFRPGAMPEAYIANAATEDERYYAPLSETVGTRPLWISPSQNRWCDVLMCRGAGLVNRHYHPQQVFAYTISGSGATWSTTGSPPRATGSTRPPASPTRWSPTSATSRCG